MTPARPADDPPSIAEGAIRAEQRTEPPAATALAAPVTTALALAPKVQGPPEPFVFRTLALLDSCNPTPAWSTAVYGPVRPDLAPDHSSVVGMESDLLHLLEALRHSPNCPLLDGGREEGPLPATLEPRWLARPQDLEYVPSPRALAPRVQWRPVVRAADRAVVVESLPAARQRWPERGVEPPQAPQTGCEGLIALGPRAERLFRLWARPDRHPPEPWNAAWNAPAVAPAGRRAADVRLPAELRGFHENGILARLPAVRRVRVRSAIPGWMITWLAVVVTLLSLWLLGKSSFADRFMPTHAEAAAPSDAAQSAFPTMSKYVEVTGVRASVDTKTSEIRYVVVNHSAAELPAFLLVAKIRPRRGGAAVCSFTATVPGMGPNESREMRTTIPRELHSYELPEWRDLRVEAHVTAK
ncbi:MAG: hypothetical protein ABSF98_23715 [Bryobacteraceae bacterium]|jgi:hypothetical protein